MLHLEATEDFGRPIRCPITLSDTARRHTGIARLVVLDTITAHFMPEDGAHIRPGGLFDLSLEVESIEPLRASVVVLSVDADQDNRGHPVLSITFRLTNFDECAHLMLRRQMEVCRPLVITTGLTFPVRVDSCQEYRVVDIADASDVLHSLSQEDVAVLVLGPFLTAAGAHALLSRLHDEFPGSLTLSIIVGVGDQHALFEEFIEGDRIFYLARSLPTNDQLRSLVAAAVDHCQLKIIGLRQRFVRRLALTDHVLAFCTRLSTQNDLPSAGGLLTETVRTMINADRSYLLLYDPDSDLLWWNDPVTRRQRSESPAAGLVGYVARTGQRVNIVKAHVDSRYDHEADDPDAIGPTCLVAEPLCGQRHSVLGVIAAVRSTETRPFSDEDVITLRLLSAAAAPFFAVLLCQSHTQRVILQRRQPLGAGSDMFRPEALEYHNHSWDQQGDILRASPSWLKRMYWLLAGLLIIAFIYLALANLDERASGPVIIRALHKTAICTETVGLVASVDVTPGDRVKAGDVLVSLHDVHGRSLVASRDPLRSSTDGVVSEVHVIPGQHLTPGEQVASIVDEDAGYEMIAFLPSSTAPQLRSGMSLILRNLAGVPGSRQLISIERVGKETVGPQEAARYIGKENTARFPITGPVIIVRSALPSPRFELAGHSYSYYDGMTGEAQVILRSERAIARLLPGLRLIAPLQRR